MWTDRNRSRQRIVDSPTLLEMPRQALATGLGADSGQSSRFGRLRLSWTAASSTIGSITFSARGGRPVKALWHRASDVDQPRGSRSAIQTRDTKATVVKIYVGNLSFQTTETEIRELFGQYGEVEEVNLITDRETGRPRGFGFIEIRDDNADREAIGALDGTELGSRQIKVNEAKPRTDRGGGSGGQRRRW